MANDLNNKIHDLEKQVKALELKLQEYTDINQYYIDKYNKLFLDIKASRDEEIKQELENMAIEISVLRNKKDDLTKAVEDNKTIEKQLQELEAHLSELYHQMEVLTLDAESEITELEQIGLQTIEQHKEELNMFTKNLNELLIPPYNTNNIILLTNEIMMYLEKEGFNDVQTLKSNHRASLEIKKSCEEKNKEFEDAINQILIDKDSLIAKYREIENDDILHIQDEIAHFTIHQEKYREEMMASFEKIKLVHEEKITDKIRKFSVLGYPRKEIGELLDEDLDIFVQELLTLDSHENITYQKEKRLKKLIKEAERLKELNIEKETINQEYTALQQSFITKQKQVRVVEDYISKIHDMIDNNISRRNFAESYLNFMRFENEVKKLIEERQTTMAKLADDNPNKGVFQLEIDGLERQYEENKMKIDELVQNPENERVLKSLLSVIEYESNLPLIYEELDSLKKQVEEKHDRLTYLQTQLVEYQSILLQIEGLTNENQD